MSRLSNDFFAGGIKSRVQPSAARSSGSFVAPSAPTLPSQARPTGSSRRGSTFAGSVAGALPNASPNEQTFGAVQSNGVSRDSFGRRGERAANQDIGTFNDGASSRNEAAVAAKQSEISGYEAEVARLNGDYNSQVNQYNSTIGQNQSAYDAALASYNSDVQGYQDRQVDIRALNDRFDNVEFYRTLLDGTNTSTNAVIRTPADRALYQGLYDQNFSLFNSYGGSLRSQYPQQAHMFTGSYGADSVGNAPDQPTNPDAPARPTLPTAPDAIVNQEQLQEMLPEAIQRRLASGQREAINGSLPPQVANKTGSTFSQENVTYGSTPLRELSQLNAQQQQNLGLPKSYRVNSGFTAQAGNNSSFGGQTFTPDQITNQSSSHYYIPGLGWTPKANVTPLY